MASPTSSITNNSAASRVPESDVRFGLENTYARLPERFYARLDPTPVRAPKLIKVNAPVAQLLALHPAQLESPQAIDIFAGSRVAETSEPLAQAYAGHQFAHFVPQLGDGRAILLGEIVGRDGIRYDVQLKGSGPTPFSRRGDGRAALGPVLREYIVSDAMAGMGIPTTRALAAVLTGEDVVRETYLPGAVLTRVAASHIRVGTFEYFAAQQDTDGVRTLSDYAITRHYPAAAQAEKPYRAFLDAVIARQATLVAQWMMVGFIHGVMNTDNMAISGETIDYGPCAFMEAYHPATVFSSIDRHGRYAYANQPQIALWNLTRFAECLLPLLEHEYGTKEAALTAATESLQKFAPQYEAAHLAGLRKKLGLTTEAENDLALARDLLERMAANQVDFTLFFRRLCDAAESPANDQAIRLLFSDPTAYDAWAERWRQRLSQEATSTEDRAATMRRANPAYIPRNHLVEEAISAAVQRQDFAPFEKLVEVVGHPFDEHPGLERYAAPAKPEERVLYTYCGT